MVSARVRVSPHAARAVFNAFVARDMGTWQPSLVQSALSIARKTLNN